MAHEPIGSLPLHLQKQQGVNELNRPSWACLKQPNADHTLPTSGVASVAHSPSGGVQ